MSQGVRPASSQHIPQCLLSLRDPSDGGDSEPDCFGWSRLFSWTMLSTLVMWAVATAVVFGGRGLFFAVFFAPVAVVPVWLHRLRREFGAHSTEIPTTHQLVRQFFKGFYVGSVVVVSATYAIVLVFSPLLSAVDTLSAWSSLILNALFSSVVLSAVCEEAAKYFFTRHYKRHFHPSLDGILIYALSVSLGLSICENILYTYAPSVALDDDAAALKALHDSWRLAKGSTTWAFVRGLLLRTVISTGQQCATGLLVGLGIARRDVLGDSKYGIVRTLFRPICYHGCYGFLTFVSVFALERFDVASALAYDFARLSVFFVVTGYALGYAQREHERMSVLSGRLAPPDCDLSDSAGLL